MPRDSDLYLDDILDSIRWIESYTSGLDRRGFESSRLVQDAVYRNLAIIGEAVKKLPPELTARRPEIGWRKVAGLRDVLIHEYSRVDVDIVWDVLTNKLAGLQSAVRDLRGL